MPFGIGLPSIKIKRRPPHALTPAQVKAIMNGMTPAQCAAILNAMTLEQLEGIAALARNPGVASTAPAATKMLIDRVIAISTLPSFAAALAAATETTSVAVR